jgi:hypothetical protein
LLIQIKRQGETSHSICIRNGAVYRVIERKRAQPRRTAATNNNDNRSKQEMAFMYEKPNTNGKETMPSGLALLRDPAVNHGTGFTEAERDKYKLRGFLPPHVHSREEQAVRVLTRLRKLTDPLEKFVALNALHDRNESLFFRVLCDNIDEMQPLVYTPTVGLACQKFWPHLSAPARTVHRRQRPRTHRAIAA